MKRFVLESSRTVCLRGRRPALRESGVGGLDAYSPHPLPASRMRCSSEQGPAGGPHRRPAGAIGGTPAW